MAVNSCLEKWLGPFDSSFFFFFSFPVDLRENSWMMGYGTEAEDTKIAKPIETLSS